MQCCSIVYLQPVSIDVGERAVEALREMDDQIIPWFQAAAAELLQDMPAEKYVRLVVQPCLEH